MVCFKVECLVALHINTICYYTKWVLCGLVGSLFIVVWYVYFGFKWLFYLVLMSKCKRFSRSLILLPGSEKEEPLSAAAPN